MWRFGHVDQDASLPHVPFDLFLGTQPFPGQNTHFFDRVHCFRLRTRRQAPNACGDGHDGFAAHVARSSTGSREHKVVPGVAALASHRVPHHAQFFRWNEEYRFPRQARLFLNPGHRLRRAADGQTTGVVGSGVGERVVGVGVSAGLGLAVGFVVGSGVGVGVVGALVHTFLHRTQHGSSASANQPASHASPASTTPFPHTATSRVPGWSSKHVPSYVCRKKFSASASDRSVNRSSDGWYTACFFMIPLAVCRMPTRWPSSCAVTWGTYPPEA